MKMNTLCYIEKNDQYLMMHRVSKDNDPNKDKWIGVGGKFEENESPDECLLREVKEETGLTLTKYSARGIVTFVSDQWETEYMHLYTATEFEGDIGRCEEGVLEWVDRDKLYTLNLWEGDKIFLEELKNNDNFFRLKLVYEGEKLIDTMIYRN